MNTRSDDAEVTQLDLGEEAPPAAGSEAGGERRPDWIRAMTITPDPRFLETT
jgi:hypothetical protein